MLAEYITTNTFLHRLNPLTKTLWFFTLTVPVFLFNNPFYCVLEFLFLVVIYLGSKLPSKAFWKILVALTPVLIILFLMTSFSYTPQQFETEYSKEVYFYLFPNNTAPLTSGGILLGLNFVLRILIMVLVSLLLTNTTSVDDFIWIAHRLRIPYTITFILTTAIRFIPTMELKAQMVIDAQRSRGANWDKSGLVKRIRQYSTVLIPMIVDSIRLSENLAVAMLCRGFGATKRPTLIDQRSFRWIDVIFVLIGFLLLLTAVFLRINDYGRL